MTDPSQHSRDDFEAQAVAAYRAEGIQPPWRRVWRNGVDVTDKPELWPELWADPAGFRRRRKR